MDNKDEIKFRWLDNKNNLGEMLFTFDGKKIYNLFRDYPSALTDVEKKEFDKNNPYWVNFFKAREQKGM